MVDFTAWPMVYCYVIVHVVVRAVHLPLPMCRLFTKNQCRFGGHIISRSEILYVPILTANVLASCLLRYSRAQTRSKNLCTLHFPDAARSGTVLRDILHIQQPKTSASMKVSAENRSLSRAD